MGHQVFIRIVFWLRGIGLLYRVKADDYGFVPIISPCRNEKNHLTFPLKFPELFKVEEIIDVYDNSSDPKVNSAIFPDTDIKFNKYRTMAEYQKVKTPLSIRSYREMEISFDFLFT